MPVGDSDGNVCLQWRTRRGAGRQPPWLEKFGANFVFRTSASSSKILKDKKYFNTVKDFRANSVFQSKRKLLNSPECKKYIQYSETFQGQTLFSGQAQVAPKP